MIKSAVPLLMLLGSLPVLADEPQPSSGQQTEEAQLPTKAWLEMQSSGAAASPQRQPLSGQAMNQIHERYIKSFSHPIPDYFKYDESLSK